MNTFKLTIVAAVLGLSLGQALAVPVPLDHPKGLALDRKGNLYVANSGNYYTGNKGQVLVYGSNYTQQTAKNIDNKDLITPLSVAVNSLDQLYVICDQQHFARAVQVYNGTVQDTTKQISAGGTTNSNYSNTPNNPYVGLSFPNGIAIDGMDNIWVSNSPPYLLQSSPAYVNVYTPTGFLMTTFPFPNEYLTAIAVSQHGPFFFESSLDIGTRIYNPIGEVLLNQRPYRGKSSYVTSAMTVDKTNKFWITNSSTGVVVVTDLGIPGDGGRVFGVLGYGPSGIAVDNARNRVYFANEALNVIDVYNTQGVYIRTIH